MFGSEKLKRERAALDAAAARPYLLQLAICDGELREVGLGANVLGSPLAAVAHLIAALAERPLYLQLQANEIVTTGTVTSAQSIQVGQTWSTQLRGIALTGLSVRIVNWKQLKDARGAVAKQKS